MIRGILGIFSGLLVWSILWLMLNLLLPLVFPKQFNSDGTSNNIIIHIVIVLLSFDFSFISGYINAIIAKVHELRFALLQGILQLGAGVYVQKQYLEAMPLWLHITFLFFIIPGILAGAAYRKTIKGRLL